MVDNSQTTSDNVSPLVIIGSFGHFGHQIWYGLGSTHDPMTTNHMMSIAVDSVAVMSIDLGSEWMKVAIVSPGVPMEIVLNFDSGRKTPIAISFRDGERLVGDSALTVGTRFPEKTFSYFLDLLAKHENSSAVQLFRKRFPHHKIEDTLNGNAS